MLSARLCQVESTTTNTKKCLLPCTPLAIVKILEYLKAYDENIPVLVICICINLKRGVE
jgi:5,10-methylene-tetrahydrofolate dehydrogenase/methenyl tetrahydrofolate cyclohydrolase